MSIEARAASWTLRTVNIRSNTLVLHISRRLARMGAVLALAIALATAGLMLAGHLAGVDIMQPLGGLWFAVDAASLNVLQVVIERHIWPPFVEPRRVPGDQYAGATCRGVQ
jgi:hypothetical protein